MSKPASTDLVKKDPTSESTAWPWDRSPEKLIWEDPDSRLTCFVDRCHEGGRSWWHGYVEVGRNHPASGMWDDDEHLIQIDVHGGVTYSGPNPLSREPGTTWRIGFDCNHGREDHGLSLQYVVRECTKLARQLYEMAKPD
jgi:hypothetical protein